MNARNNLMKGYCLESISPKGQPLFCSSSTEREINHCDQLPVNDDLASTHLLFCFAVFELKGCNDHHAEPVANFVEVWHGHHSTFIKPPY